MILCLWLILTLVIGVSIGLVAMGCLVAGKIADLEGKIANLKRALWVSEILVDELKIRRQVADSNQNC